MLKSLRQSKGFTIIEVMIVLAIAGMIILVVLLAVPALQRSGRNTALKNDASAVVSGITEFSSNNDGALPTVAGSPSTSNGTYVIQSAAPASPVTVKVQANTTVTPLALANAPAAPPAVGTINIIFGARCVSTTYAAAADVAAAPRSSAVIYSVEGANGAVNGKCIGS